MRDAGQSLSDVSNHYFGCDTFKAVQALLLSSSSCPRACPPLRRRRTPHTRCCSWKRRGITLLGAATRLRSQLQLNAALQEILQPPAPMELRRTLPTAAMRMPAQQHQSAAQRQSCPILEPVASSAAQRQRRPNPRTATSPVAQRHRVAILRIATSPGLGCGTACRCRQPTKPIAGRPASSLSTSRPAKRG